MASSSARSRRRVPASRSIGSGSGTGIRDCRQLSAHRAARNAPMTPYPIAVGSNTTATKTR